MSYQEKRALIVCISTILILGLYSLFVFYSYHDTILSDPNDFRFWGKVFLILIPVSIIAHIVIAIVFNIINRIVTNESIPCFSDERDKLIELRAINISHWVFVLGFLLSMGSQAIGMEPWVMFMTLAVSGSLSGCASEITKFYLYRKGF